MDRSTTADETNSEVRTESTDQREWSFGQTVPVGDDRKLRLPGEVYEEIAFDHPLRPGRKVHWGYEVNSDYVVISKRELRADDYVPLDSTKVLESSPGDGEKTYRYIRPPDGFPNRILLKFERADNQFTYYAHGDMLDDNPAAWLLDRNDLMGLLPTEQRSDADPDVNRLLDNPNLLPSL